VARAFNRFGKPQTGGLILWRIRQLVIDHFETTRDKILNSFDWDRISGCGGVFFWAGAFQKPGSRTPVGSGGMLERASWANVGFEFGAAEPPAKFLIT
jgi:hypothetical protein